MTLKGFYNSNWVENGNDHQSTMEYIFFVGNGATLSNCKKQLIVALSTTEAELITWLQAIAST